MWNFRLAILSFVMTVVIAVSGVWEPLMEAEFVAEALAPRVSIDEGVLRAHLISILVVYPYRRAVVLSSPWAFLTLVFAIRAWRDKRESDPGRS
jgi:hypothetical protein